MAVCRICREYPPDLMVGSEDEIHPVSINTNEICTQETGSPSRANAHHVSIGVDLILNALEKIPGLRILDFGIVCGYALQQHSWVEALKEVRVKYPALPWCYMRFGTAENWQENEAKIMIIDICRAENDAGNIRFMRDPKRINVMITRQRYGPYIIGDSLSIELERGSITYEPNPVQDPKGKGKQREEDG